MNDYRANEHIMFRRLSADDIKRIVGGNIANAWSLRAKLSKARYDSQQALKSGRAR